MSETATSGDRDSKTDRDGRHKPKVKATLVEGGTESQKDPDDRSFEKK